MQIHPGDSNDIEKVIQVDKNYFSTSFLPYLIYKNTL